MSALKKLIETVEATGGLIQFESGLCAPYADPEWLDLGDVVLAAKEELEREGEDVVLTIEHEFNVEW